MKHFQHVACGIFAWILAVVSFVGGASGLIAALKAIHGHSEKVELFSGHLPMLFISPVVAIIGIAFFFSPSPRIERSFVIVLPWAAGLFAIALLTLILMPMDWYVARHGYSRCPKPAYGGTRTLTTVWYRDDVSSCTPRLAP